MHWPDELHASTVQGLPSLAQTQVDGEEEPPEPPVQIPPWHVPPVQPVPLATAGNMHTPALQVLVVQGLLSLQFVDDVHMLDATQRPLPLHMPGRAFEAMQEVP